MTEYEAFHILYIIINKTHIKNTSHPIISANDNINLSYLYGLWDSESKCTFCEEKILGPNRGLIITKIKNNKTGYTCFDKKCIVKGLQHINITINDLKKLINGKNII